MAGRKLNLAAIIALTAPSFAVAMLVAPLFAVLPTHYATNTTTTMVAIGSILFFARISDAILDPLIGYLSDRTRSPFGKRKPWIAAGTALATIAVYPLFVPPADADASYFLIWSLIAYCAWTMVSVPSGAWHAEITGDYTERARIVTFGNVFGTIGGMAFFLLPYLPIFPTTAITGDVLKLAAVTLMISMPILVGYALWACPSGAEVAIRPPTLKSDIRAIATNGPFHIFLGAFFFFGCGAGIYAAALMLVVGDHFRIAEQFSAITIAAAVAHLVGTPIWFQIVKWIGKHRSWAVGTIIPLIAGPVVFFIPPGPDSFIPFASIVTASSFGFASAGIAAAMLADIVDYDTLRTGQRRTASYYAFYLLATKACVAIGGGLGFIALGLTGYKAGATNSDASQLALLIVFAVVPTILYMAAMIVLWRYPITERRQAAIRKRLEQRADRMHRVTATTVSDIPAALSLQKA